MCVCVREGLGEKRVHLPFLIECSNVPASLCSFPQILPSFLSPSRPTWCEFVCVCVCVQCRAGIQIHRVTTQSLNKYYQTPITHTRSLALALSHTLLPDAHTHTFSPGFRREFYSFPPLSLPLLFSLDILLCLLPRSLSLVPSPSFPLPRSLSLSVFF